MQIPRHSEKSNKGSKLNSITVLLPIKEYCLGLSELNLSPKPAEGNIATNGFINLFLVF